jgi:lysine 2,3-aminomutase
MISGYDRVKGITYWRKNYRTGIEYDDPEALSREYPYYDPVYTLPEEGQEFWREQMRKQGARELQPV